MYEHIPNTKHTEQTKFAALAIVAETNSATTAAEALNLPRSTVSTWLKDPECDATLDTLRQLMRSKLAHTHILNAQLASYQLTDRIMNGDHHTDKEGNIVRIPVRARELAYVMGMCSDKHAILMGQMQERKNDNGLKALADQLTNVTNLLAKNNIDKANDKVDIDSPDNLSQHLT